MPGLKLVRDEPAPPTCGDEGGRTKSGAPCQRPAAWGLPGDSGPCRNHVHAAPVASGTRSPPEHLSPESAALWREIVTMYEFGPEGFPILEGALQARDRATEAREEIQRTGLLFVNQETGTPHRNPMIAVERDALREFRLAWRQLDLDIAPPLEDQR